MNRVNSVNAIYRNLHMHIYTQRPRISGFLFPDAEPREYFVYNSFLYSAAVRLG